MATLGPKTTEEFQEGRLHGAKHSPCGAFRRNGPSPEKGAVIERSL